MKRILLIILLLSSSVWSAPKSIGKILNRKPSVKEPSFIEFQYSENKLSIVHRNSCMNSGASQVGGTIKVKENMIVIRSVEIYESAEADSLELFDIQYSVPNILPCKYILIVDDSRTEGTDRKIMVELDLSKPTKGTNKK